MYISNLDHKSATCKRLIFKPREDQMIDRLEDQLITY